ncbi:hypothetical protein GF371_05525 [Candidatus Woesearchaeota archaeon]|nr:hypothetical protein [Candidatus Woesearchaeota archaeon]
MISNSGWFQEEIKLKTKAFKNKEDSISNNSSSTSSDDLLLSAMSKDDLKNVLRRISAHLEKRCGVSKEEQQKMLFEEEEKTVPVEAFGTKLSPSESLIKFLKENEKENYHEIAVELNRDERGIWSGYRRAKQKMPRRYSVRKPAANIPVSIFKNRELSILENVVMFLKDSLNWKLVQIARILNKKPTTISTAYSRAKEKSGAKQVKGKGGDRRKKMEVSEE